MTWRGTTRGHVVGWIVSSSTDTAPHHLPDVKPGVGRDFYKGIVTMIWLSLPLWFGIAMVIWSLT